MVFMGWKSSCHGPHMAVPCVGQGCPLVLRRRARVGTLIESKIMRFHTVRHPACLVTARAAAVEHVAEWCATIGSPGTFLLHEQGDADGQGYVATEDAPKGSILLAMPGDIAVTLTDVEHDEELGGLIQGRSELISLAIFLSKHRVLGSDSPWKYLIDTLPESVDSPIFWSEEDRLSLLKGSPVAVEASQRFKALEKEWDSLQNARPDWLDKSLFFKSMSVVLRHAIFLPSVQCFALLPIMGDIQKTGSEAGAVIDYDVDSNMVCLTSSVRVNAGETIQVFDGRPNGEIFMATGTVERANPSDFLTLNASLVAADRLYQMKEEVANAMDLGVSVDFPIYEDRLATQHLAYLRMSRLTDPAQMARVSFEDDVIISQENEYEILQLLMGDLREMLQKYETGMEEDVKELQRKDLSRRERMSAMLRLGEKRILRGTMDGVRTRLAPIRGIPTKSGGLQDPNADLIEIFETIESIPTAPRKILEGIKSWARGDQDPNWKR